MLNDEKRDYLLKVNSKLILYLNEVIGTGKNKIMSQCELAKTIGCSNSTVSRWLKGESPLSIDIAIKICDILNINKKDFLAEIFLLDNDLQEKIMKLSNKNKKRVIDYINFLIYQEKNDKITIKIRRGKYRRKIK